MSRPKPRAVTPAAQPARAAGALFLDRDGTLIVDKAYLADPAGVELITGVAEALRRARLLGYKLFLFTNQSGVGRGYHTMDDARRVNRRLEELLGPPGPAFDGICIAPEAPDQPVVYRKPSPRFILEMIAQHRLAPAACYMVGDSAADVQAALNAGIRPVVVRTGRVDPRTLSEVTRHDVPVFDDLAAFVDTLG
ncbi:MAG TPA: HAD-IIIA family hydrolase [Opitutaceae bacterium]|nr:HAD-IIIA family hydrolase [Opitutaceae bacterium]